MVGITSLAGVSLQAIYYIFPSLISPVTLHTESAETVWQVTENDYSQIKFKRL